MVPSAINLTAGRRRTTHSGRAEALHRIVLKLIGIGTAQETHPAYCAPFVVVGEGGTARSCAEKAWQDDRDSGAHCRDRAGSFVLGSGGARGA